MVEQSTIDFIAQILLFLILYGGSLLIIIYFSYDAVKNKNITFFEITIWVLLIGSIIIEFCKIIDV